MFTVCPKCALTLVVTAADLRVAQGYVRCGRCSNVFNALARLSEDRNAAAAAAASQGVPPSSTGVHPRPQPTAVPSSTSQPSPTPARPQPPAGPSSSFTFNRLPDTPAPTARAPQQTATPRPAQGTGSTAQPPDTNAAAARSSPPPTVPLTRPQQSAGTPPRPPQAPSAHVWSQQAAPSAAPPPAAAAPSRLAPPPPLSLEFDDEDAIPEDALEFNADADVNQVFVEPPPNPEWTAATGTFKAIVLKSEEAIHGPAASAPNAMPVPGQPTAANAANRSGSTSRGSMGSSSTSQESPTFDSLDLSAPEPAPFGSSPVGLSSSFGEDEFELDPDFLSATAEMRKLKTGLGDMDAGAGTGTGAGAPRPNTLSSQPAAPAQPPVPPSARLAPRGPLPDAPIQSSFRASPSETPPQTQFRASGADAQPHARSASSDTAAPTRASPAETQSRQTLKPPPLDAETFFEPQVVSTRPPTRTAAVKAFGLDSVAEPPPERLAALARSRVAPGGVELETAPPPTRLLPNLATLWSAGSGALVILLAAQIVNHYRNDIAATAQFNKPITALYAALGVHLTPRWDLHAYDVRQLGASVDSASAGQIMVRASVKNGAHQPQPMPLLRVTLQDRFGNRIAARDVPPGSYLPRATAATAFLPAGQRIDAEMAFVDPGSNAVGFEIDACLPAPAGGIACANDTVAR
jgi:predicted Zn finger-like uncharacterized protein